MRTPPFSKLACVGADTSATHWRAKSWSKPVPLAADLQRLVRALPSPATGRQLVTFMEAALELSDRSGRSTAARQRLSDAVNSPASAGLKEMGVKYAPTTPGYAAAIKLATEAVAAASAAAGARADQLQAVKELPGDIAREGKKKLEEGLSVGTALLGAAAILGGAYLLKS